MKTSYKTTLHIGLSISEDKAAYMSPLVMRWAALHYAKEVLESFNVTETVGYWKGEKEESIQISWISPTLETKVGDDLARKICAELYQDCVLVERSEVNIDFL
jgi:hypothetical protein